MLDLYALGATRIVIGLSNIVRVTPAAFQNSLMMRIVTATAGGTLEIVPPSTFTAGTGWGTGYALGVGTEYAYAGPITFYLAATGVTQTIAMQMGCSQGYSLI